MFVFAGLLGLCGGAMLVIAGGIDWDQVMDQSERVYGPEFTKAMQQQGSTPQQMKMGVMVWAAIGLAAGIGFALLGFFVFRGSGGAIVTSIVFTSLLLLLNLCSGAATALVALRMGPAGLLATVFAIIPLIASSTLMFLLVRAAKDASQGQKVLQHAQVQHWQQMQQQLPPQQRYGYGAPGAPPAPSFGPNPPPPPDEQNAGPGGIANG